MLIQINLYHNQKKYSYLPSDGHTRKTTKQCYVLKEQCHEISEIFLDQKTPPWPICTGKNGFAKFFIFILA